jgi:hypothetical protein
MAKTRRTRRRKHSQKGGFRRVRVNLGETKKEGRLYGIDKESGFYVILLEGQLVKVDPKLVEILNSAKGALNKKCATCGLNPQHISEKELLTRSMSPEKARSGLYVPQDAFVIQGKNAPVLTYGLATCTALSMVIGKQRFLAHISAQTDVVPMIMEIVKTIKAEKVRPTEVKVWTGLGGSSNNADPVLKNSPSFYSLNNVERILSVLEIPLESIHIEDSCFAEVVGF